MIVAAKEQENGPRDSDDGRALPRREASAADWLVETQFDLPGAHHMERDEALARERIADRDLPPVLRLYSWQPAAVSLGFQQKEQSVDLAACKAHGIDVVRRPTGGRAVLHFNELTYAVVMQTDPGEGIYAAHNRIVQALLLSLEALGEEYRTLEITGRQTHPDFRHVYKPGTLTNAACFASSARHEVTFGGRKVIGSAQRRFGDVLLQHGSILLAADHLLLPDLLTLAPEERQKMREHLGRETATLSQVFGRPLEPQEVANGISARFPHHICAPEIAPS